MSFHCTISIYRCFLFDIWYAFHEGHHNSLLPWRQIYPVHPRKYNFIKLIVSYGRQSIKSRGIPQHYQPCGRYVTHIPHTYNSCHWNIFHWLLSHSNIAVSIATTYRSNENSGIVLILAYLPHAWSAIGKDQRKSVNKRWYMIQNKIKHEKDPIFDWECVSKQCQICLKITKLPIRPSSQT